MSTNLKQIHFTDMFDVKLTTGEIDIGWTEQTHEEFTTLSQQKMSDAIKIANHAECGLLLHVYEGHTEYFLDLEKPEGDITELLFRGVNDVRN